MCLQRNWEYIIFSLNAIFTAQDRQCRCKITLRRVYETVAAVERNKYYIFLCACVCAVGWVRECACMRECTDAGVCFRACSLANSAYNAHAPYCHLRPVWLHHIFPHYLINGTISWKKKVTEPKVCVLIFSTNFVWNISHCKKHSTSYCHKCENVLMLNIRCYCRIIIKLEFSQQIFEESSTTKFLQNSSNDSRVFPCGRADGWTWN